MTKIKALVIILGVIGFLSILGGISITFLGGIVNGQGVNNIFVGGFIIGIGALIWHYKKPKSQKMINQ